MTSRIDTAEIKSPKVCAQKNPKNPNTRGIRVATRTFGDTDATAALLPGTGKKCLESFFCCSAESCQSKKMDFQKISNNTLTFFTLKATKPTMTPRAKNIKAWISQITPHTEILRLFWKQQSEREGGPRDGQHPQISANAAASEPLAFRAIVSSSVNDESMSIQPHMRKRRSEPITSHTQYKHDMTPMNRTYNKAPQNRTTKPF